MVVVVVVVGGGGSGGGWWWSWWVVVVVVGGGGGGWWWWVVVVVGWVGGGGSDHFGPIHLGRPRGCANHVVVLRVDPALGSLAQFPSKLGRVRTYCALEGPAGPGGSTWSRGLLQ